MGNRELREWFGVTLADLLVYIAAALIGAMFFVSNPTVDILLALAGVFLAMAACPLGMKRDPMVSDFTNVVKLVAYPLCVVIAVGAIVVHYVWFNS